MPSGEYGSGPPNGSHVAPPSEDLKSVDCPTPTSVPEVGSIGRMGLSPSIGAAVHVAPRSVERSKRPVVAQYSVPLAVRKGDALEACVATRFHESPPSVER